MPDNIETPLAEELDFTPDNIALYEAYSAQSKLTFTLQFTNNALVEFSNGTHTVLRDPEAPRLPDTCTYFSASKQYNLEPSQHLAYSSTLDDHHVCSHPENVKRSCVVCSFGSRQMRCQLFKADDEIIILETKDKRLVSRRVRLGEQALEIMNGDKVISAATGAKVDLDVAKREFIALCQDDAPTQPSLPIDAAPHRASFLATLYNAAN